MHADLYQHQMEQNHKLTTVAYDRHVGNTEDAQLQAEADSGFEVYGFLP